MPNSLSSGQPAHVLYVDDEKPNLIVFQAACGHLYPTLTATNAEDALVLMRQYEIAVLLADQRMPGVTGVQLLARARRASPNSVRMLVTAYSNLEAAVAAINEGMVRRYISKPWTTAEMVATVADAYKVYETETALRSLEQRLVETERYYALGVVSAGIAHELRNPATWVSNSVELCQRTMDQLREELHRPTADTELLESLLQRADKLLENALDGGQRILDIVRSVEGPTRKQTDEEIDLGKLWQATLNLVDYHTCGRVPIDSSDAPWPKARGSSTALGQVLSNVLINAVEAVDPHVGGRVWVSHTEQEGMLVLTVDDNGPGIREEDCERIFDPFHTSGKPGGSGLGLAISRRIAREHGGELTATRSPQGGARFTLHLPLTPPGSRRN